jgi:hypothetical protein
MAGQRNAIAPTEKCGMRENVNLSADDTYPLEVDIRNCPVKSKVFNVAAVNSINSIPSPEW